MWQSQGKTAEAHDFLFLVYDWFTEGFDTKDLRETNRLLNVLNQVIWSRPKRTGLGKTRLEVMCSSVYNWT